jgi:hypothetical protein
MHVLSSRMSSHALGKSIFSLGTFIIVTSYDHFSISIQQLKGTSVLLYFVLTFLKNVLCFVPVPESLLVDMLLIGRQHA